MRREAQWNVQQGSIVMKEISKLSLLLPLLLFLSVVIVDVNIISGGIGYVFGSYVREVLLFAALILSLPLVYLQRWASDRNVLRGLRSLFFLIILTYLLLVFSSGRLETILEEISKGQTIYDNLAYYVLLLSWAFFMTVFMLIVLGTLRNLIFIKRKKSTARNFTWLMILLLAYAVLSVGERMPEEFPPFYLGPSQAIPYMALFVLIVFMVLNSFRVSWINYLNKKQKLACFWGGLLLLPLQSHFFSRFHDANPVAAFSPLLGTFVEFGIIFLTIYLYMAFLALIAHLPTAQIYDRKMHQISSLHNLSRAISSEFDFEKLVSTIVRLTAEVTEADFSWLELNDAESGELRLVSTVNLKTRDQKRWQEFENPLRKLLQEQGNPFLSNQAAKNQATRFITRWHRDIHSVLAVPLKAPDKVIGFLYAGKRIEFGFEQDDVDMLQAFSQQVVIAVENQRLVHESIVKERLEQELRIAHDAQMKLLPERMPELEGFEIDAVCITANEVGGDYYDFFHLGQDRWGVVIGDVSGKGASAAFYMAEIKGIMGALARVHRSPKRILAEANKTLFANLDRQTFITAICGIIDTRKKNFTFCRAGHCPVLLTRNGGDGCEVLEPGGLGLGLDRGPLFEKSLQEVRFRFHPGQACLLFTDGVVESRRTDGEEFGEKRLQDSFVKFKGLSASEIRDQIIKEIRSFTGQPKSHDDYSFVIIKAL